MCILLEYCTYPFLIIRDKRICNYYYNYKLPNNPKFKEKLFKLVDVSTNTVIKTTLIAWFLFLAVVM